MKLKPLRKAKVTLSLALGLSMVLSSMPPLTVSAANDAGMPVFKNVGPVLPAEPVAYTPEQSMMQLMYHAEANGTDFWIDRVLARPGDDPAKEARGVDLMTRGRALYMMEHTPAMLGFAGKTAYQNTLGGSAYTVTIDNVTLAEDINQRLQMPSHWKSEHVASNLRVIQHKFITNSNVAVTLLTLTNTSSEPETYTLTVNPSFVSRSDGNELVGTVNSPRNLTKINTRISGSEMTVDGNKLTRTITIASGESAEVNVSMGFLTTEIPESTLEYNTYRELSNEHALEKQTQDYNKWWAENIPYIDVPDENIKKIAYYRWWLNRFNYLDANIPGNDFQFPTSIEGVLGYNNAIVLTQPMHIQDLQYLRNPMYAYGDWVSVGETSNGAAFTDNPGMPNNWNNYYTQYLSRAAWDSYKVHGGPSEIIEKLAYYAEKDVEGQLYRFDKNNNKVIAYDIGHMTGNDADAVSFHWRSGDMERTESAYVYAGAKAASEMYHLLGNDAKEAELAELAEEIRTGILDVLWDKDEKLFKQRHVSTNALNPWKEINNYYPFTEGVPPADDNYKEAFRLWQDAAEYPIFPFFTANQKDKAAAAAQGEPGSNNFSTINSTVTFRFFAKALRDYPSQYITEEMYKQLLYWAAWAQYYNGDTRYPDANEFWANWNAGTKTIQYRSWIHHNILGNYNYTLIEDIAGLRPRLDDNIELWPIDIGWDHFTVNNLNYHDHDLTIVWDKPDDGTVHYDTAPEGYSVYIDGERMFTVDDLVHLVWDSKTGTVTFPNDAGNVLYQQSIDGFKQAQDVALTEARIVDMFQKAGLDLSSETGGLPNLAQAEGVSASASFTAATTSVAAAVDGFTISGTSKPREAAFAPPIWGSNGSTAAEDWYELDFGQDTTFDNVKLYFYNDRFVSGEYSEPSLYRVEYWDGSEWVIVENQYKLPKMPQANLNEVQFQAVTASKLRVQMTHKGTNKTALKEIQVYHTGNIPPIPINEQPEVSAEVAAGPSLPLQVNLVASALDDGLPNATLTVGWSKLSGPGDVVFSNPNELTTSATFTEAGTYLLQFEASDGVLSSSTEVTVVIDPLPAEVNIASNATVTTSYISSWETLTAVNDGLDWPNSNPSNGVEAGGIPRYGNWSLQGTQWVEYTWSEPVRIGKSSVSWFDDGGGVMVPASWKLQYWDGDQFVDVAEPSKYGLTKDGYNDVQFKPVTTAKLRIVMESNNASTGILEWKVFAESPIYIKTIKMPTLVGVQPELPQTIEQTYVDGSVSMGKVSWFPIEQELLQNSGSSFTVKGIVEGSPIQAEAIIYVRVTDAVSVTNISDVNVVTEVDKAPLLPIAADVLFNDGSQDNINHVITWDEIDPSAYAQAGSFTVEGTIAASERKVKAYITVTSGEVDEITSVQVATVAGVAPELPSKVSVTFADGGSTELNVVWDTIEASQYASAGSFIVYGTVTGTIKKAVATVTVTEEQVPVTGVTLSESALQLTVGEERTLSVTVVPETATNKDVSWSSSNSDVATVNTEGEVSAITAGTATITVTTEDGAHTASVAVTVIATDVAVAGVTLSSTTLSLKVGNSYKLAVTVSPSNATNQNVSWTSSDSKVATVDERGNVTAIAAGTATITVTTLDGGFTAEATVNVSRSGGGGTPTPVETPQPTATPQPAETPVPTSTPTPTATPQPIKPQFTDLTNYTWAEEAIAVLTEKGIVKGTSETTFAPSSNITRADFVTLLVRALGLKADVSGSFEDVAKDAYYYEAIAIAKQMGIATGISKDLFNPQGEITRQDMMVLVARALKVAGKQQQAGNEAGLNEFVDKSEIAGYAIEAVAALVKDGIIIGDSKGRINPRGVATRAETAVMLYRIIEKYNLLSQ